MKRHIKNIAVIIILSFITATMLTACGTKGSYTGNGRHGGGAADGNIAEPSEALSSETDKQTTEKSTEQTKETEPETEYNGRYYEVKNVHSEGTVDWVRLHGLNGELYIEYDGKQVAVPWATQGMGTGEGGSFYLQDVTGDGYEDLIGAIIIREQQPFFVYDLKNGKDLSPYYCKGHDLYKGLFTKEEYAVQIEAVINPLLEEIGMAPIDMLNKCCCDSRGLRGEDGFFENNKLLYYYDVSTANEAEWLCLVSFDFTGGECKMEIVKVQTRYTKYKGMLDVEGEYVLEPNVSVESGGYNYTLSFKGNDISIILYIDANGSFVPVIAEYKGKEYDTDWNFDYRVDKLYFELYDYDSDGADELLYHKVTDGDDEVSVYEFEQ